MAGVGVHAGVPMVRKYNAAGVLLFERHIEGTELDPILQNLPSTWPRRRTGGANRELPLIGPQIQAAVSAPDGRLWIALTLPYVYVFDKAGDKEGVFELFGAGPISPASLAFSRAGRLIVTPGGYEFDVPAKKRAAPGSMP